jgi:O-antigen ligase
MTAERRGWWDQVVWAIWIALLVSIPVTTFPVLSKALGGETPVAPLALIPLALLTVLWLFPYALKGGKIPGVASPLLGFGLVALIAAVAATLLPILPYKGLTPPGREARALLTIALGLSFYLVASILPGTEARRKISLRAIYLGAGVAFAWASVQGWVALSGADHVPLIITRIQHLFSVRDPFVDRVVGMSYEPSWLGNQLMVLYIPLLAAATFTRRSVFSDRRGWLSVESVMLLWSMAVLALTKSRISQISLLLLASLGLIAAGWKILAAVERRIGWMPPSGRAPQRILLAVLNLLILAALVMGLASGAAAAVGRADPRLWALSSMGDRLAEIRRLYPNDVAMAVGDRLAFAERLVYWISAFRTFSLYPVLGVGPGNAGFFFEQTLPEYGLRLSEIQAVLRSPSFGFPNPKNLWTRLLAETGIVGLVLFIVWLGLVGFGSLVLWRRGRRLEPYLGLAGVLAVLAQLVEGFSLDSFALPQLWILFGLTTAAVWHFRSGPPSAAVGEAWGRSAAGTHAPPEPTASG